MLPVNCDDFFNTIAFMLLAYIGFFTGNYDILALVMEIIWYAAQMHSFAQISDSIIDR